MSYLILSKAPFAPADALPSVRYNEAWADVIGLWGMKDGTFEELDTGEVLAVRSAETWEDNI